MHLAEIYLDSGRYDDAEALLIPVVSSGDPEVLWRLADVSAALERDADAVNHLESARRGFESLLEQAPARFRGPRRRVLCRQWQRS